MNTTPTASVTPARIRRQITSALLALSLSVGMIAATPTPAHAATYVKGCFTYQGSGAALWDMPVRLWAWDGHNWYPVGASKKLSATGCQVWDNLGVYANAYVTMGVDSTQGNRRYTGFTPYYAPPGSGVYNLGTGVVTAR